MSSIKTFGELSESILKLRENFDAILGNKHQNLILSPLKQKDLMSEFGNHNAYNEEIEGVSK